MMLRLRLIWIAIRYPAFTKWALDNAAREALVGRRTFTGGVSRDAGKVASVMDTTVYQMYDDVA